MELLTQRLRLDALRETDAETLFHYRADPVVNRYQGWSPASVNDALRFIDAQRAVPPDMPGSWYQRAIRLRDSGELVGDLGLHFLEDVEATVELGISLAPAYQGHGFAAEALKAVLACLFDELQKHRVFGSVDPRNLPCVKLLEGLGLRKEAHFQESLWCDGAWVDDAIYAMLAREWRERRAV